ncbi:Hypothetical protein SMAX5B_015309 [Scophthalmus maximus]|uniref:Uncharacterized protein n=1 Tax=Scophthalmus maximus TaxID=52904 RepID=A0A2U9B6U4_SCOMX|nr:Hypothetical protein SMAX5B_015309 [Scophthalmus maximus]
MATEAETRSSYVTPLELEIRLCVYGENQMILRKRSISAAAGEERQSLPESTCFNPTGTKIMWLQLKMNYKNMELKEAPTGAEGPEFGSFQG